MIPCEPNQPPSPAPTPDPPDLYTLAPESHPPVPPMFEAPPAPSITNAAVAPKCPRCGYIVVGLERSICPECGGNVDWSRAWQVTDDSRQLRWARLERVSLIAGAVLYTGSCVFGIYATYQDPILGAVVLPAVLISAIVLAYRAANSDPIRAPLLLFGLLGGAWVAASFI